MSAREIAHQLGLPADTAHEREPRAFALDRFDDRLAPAAQGDRKAQERVRRVRQAAADHHGDVWQRTALPPATKSLIMVAMMAGAGHGNELGVHIRGARKNGCTAEQIQEVLLLLALYCGIPAANDAHRIAVNTLREA